MKTIFFTEYPLDTRLTNMPIKKICTCLLFCVWVFNAVSHVKDVGQHDQKAGDPVAMASFFPASSPFFNTQSNRLNRKKLSRRLEIANSENYSTFKKKNGSLLNLVKQMGNHPENRDILIFWQLGEQISIEKTRHQGSITYAAFFMDHLSNDLGLDITLLSKIETFYTLYTVVASVSMELTW